MPDAKFVYLSYDAMERVDCVDIKAYMAENHRTPSYAKFIYLSGPGYFVRLKEEFWPEAGAFMDAIDKPFKEMSQ